MKEIIKIIDAYWKFDENSIDREKELLVSFIKYCNDNFNLALSDNTVNDFFNEK